MEKINADKKPDANVEQAVKKIGFFGHLKNVLATSAIGSAAVAICSNFNPITSIGGIIGSVTASIAREVLNTKWPANDVLSRLLKAGCFTCLGALPAAVLALLTTLNPLALVGGAALAAFLSSTFDSGLLEGRSKKLSKA